MFNAETTKLSLYARTTNPIPVQSLTLFEAYRMIVGEVGSDDLRKLTENLRSISDPDTKREHDLKRDFKKNNFPAISFGGTFSRRSNNDLLKASNLVCLDFDHIGTGAELESIKERISQESELDPLLLFVSPSGDGLKVVVNVRQEITSDDDFKRSYKSLRRFCKEVLNLDPDEARKDISGLCYLPYDGHAILRQQGRGFDVEKWKPAETPRPQVSQTDNRPLGSSMGLTDEPTDYERAVIAVEDIELSGIDITSDRKDWRDIGFALSTLGEAGRDLFHRVSRFYPSYDQQETDKQFNSFVRGTGRGITLNSLFAIARKYGVKMRSSKVYSQKPQKRVKTDTNQVVPEIPPFDPNVAPKRAKMTDYSTQGKTQRTEFPELLEPTSEREMIERGRNLPEALATGYSIKGNESGQRQKLLLMAGKLTEIAGATGHGKTLFLMNILLNVARKYPEKRFVLFTYEENSDTILSYLLNIYLNDLNLMKPNDWRTNRILLYEYFRTGGTDNFNPKKIADFTKRKDLFFRQYIETGRILVKYVDSDSSTLCRQIEYLSRQNNVGGVFVDYFQCVNPDPEKRFPTRQEALKSICFDLKDVANKTGLPVVLACQFNQEVQSPTDVLLNKIGEAGDISRIGAEVWGLWQMRKDLGRKLDNDDKQRYENLKQASDTMGLDDPFLSGMFIRVLKSRIVETGSEDMFRYRGLTGKFSVNDPDEMTDNPKKDGDRLSVNDWEKPDPTLNLAEDEDLPY